MTKNDDFVNQGVYKRVAGVEIDVDTAISGQITVTTAGTSVQGSDVDLTNGVWLIGNPANTGSGWVRSASGDGRTTGYPISASLPTLVMVTNLNQLWIDVSVSGEKICWLKA